MGKDLRLWRRSPGRGFSRRALMSSATSAAVAGVAVPAHRMSRFHMATS